MEMLKLAIDSGLPVIHVRTDDIINIADVLSFIADETVNPVQIPESIPKIEDFKMPPGRVFYTSGETKSLAKLYRHLIDKEKTVIFVNTEKSVIMFDGGLVLPPMKMVVQLLGEISEEPEELMPAFGGLTIKDITEIAKMTMTRDGSLTVRGVNETRRGYTNLKGITQVDTALSYYVTPPTLEDWMTKNAKMFTHPIHASLTPRGLLFDGPPGTGKTLASKHIASEFGVPLYRLDLGGLMGKYVGESESNLNAALSQVDQVEPCVVILDEVEKVFQSQGDSGVTSRLLSTLLWWLQEHKSKVFTVMTTNDMSKIPEELYREGRIDHTLGFMGIENFADGYAFTKGAFDTMLGEVAEGSTTGPEAYKDLSKRIKTLYVDGRPVPQSKLTQMAYSMVREVVSLGENDE